MRLSLRLILFLVAGITLVTFVVARNQVSVEQAGLRTDMQRRAAILAESLQEIIEPALESGSRDQMRRTVERFGNRQGLAGVLVYSSRGDVLAESPSLTTRLSPPPAPIERLSREDEGFGEFVRLAGKDMHVYYLPLHNADSFVGALAIFHDAGYIEAQSAQIWRETLWHVVAQVLLVDHTGSSLDI